MKAKFLNVGIYLVLFALLVQLLPSFAFAEEKEAIDEVVLFADSADEFISLFEDKDEKTVLVEIPDHTIVQMIEEEADYALVEYHQDEQVWTGYVRQKHVFDQAEAEAIREQREEAAVEKEEVEEIEEEANPNAEKEETPVSEVEQEKKEDVAVPKEESAEEKSPTRDESTVEAPAPRIANNEETAPKNLEEPSPTITGVAIENPTNVYAKTSTSSTPLKNYSYGKLLKYRTFNSEWFEATVYINGKATTGYIYQSHVGDINTKLQGYALANPTKVYSERSTSAGVLKNYNTGKLLKYSAYDSNWFQATVIVQGKAKTGYISVKDVGANPPLIKGFATASPTNVYSKTSKSSNKLKSYKQGSSIKYRPYNKDWYKATVKLNGKSHTGYIHVKDAGETAPLLTGYAQASPTNVYSKTSKSSSKLKSYKHGSSIKYRPYNKDWYKATVKLNGKSHTGYIYVKDAGEAAPLIKGYAQASPTYVYSKTSKSSAKLKSYSKGAQIKYRAFNKDWYKVTVKLNGKSHTGYIHVKDAGQTAPLLTGYAHANPTYVYSKTSKGATKLKSYKRGHALKYRVYNKDWYRATVKINGKSRTGFIYKQDVGEKKPSSAGNKTIVNPNKVYTYNHMVTDIKKLQQEYPDLISYKVIGKSEYGRNIYAVSLGKGKPTTFINGSHHAREWLTTNLNMYMLDQYAKAYYKNQKIQNFDVRKILNSTTIWFVPMVNPDGVTLQQQGLKAFPKSTHASLIRMNGGSRDFTRWKANAKGIDLNRQYDAGWKTIRNNAKGPSYKNFKGYKPASAAEVKALLKFVDVIDPEIAVAYHTSGKILYWNYLQTGAHYQRDLVMARTIGRMTGYTLYNPIGVPSGGGFTDWFIQAKKRPGFTPEISRYVYETNPPLSEFSGAWRENKGVGLYVAQESAKLYKTRVKR